MDFDWPPDDAPVRLEIREWLNEHGGDPTQEALARAGYVAPHWPKPYGLGADPIDQLIIEKELASAGVKRAAGGIGLGWPGRQFCSAEPHNSKTVTFGQFSLERRSGASFSANQTAGRI